MRAYKILPVPVIEAASLSKDGLKRLAWIDWYFFHGKNAEETCRHFAISKSVFYRWFNRFNRRNLKTLEFDTKTRRPHHVREMTTPKSIQDEIYEIRLDDLEKSKWEIHEELKRKGIMVAHNVIQRVINKHPELTNIQHKKQVKKRKGRHIARMKAEAVLRDQGLGSLVQMDTKYFYVLGKVRVYFPFTILAVNTDNGSEYLLHFHKELEQEWKIPHYFTNPNCPKQNGRVERLHQTAEYEYFNYQDDLLDDLEMINQKCMEFNTKYNTKRFHRSLGYKTPYEYVMIHLHKKGEQAVLYL